MEFEQTLITTKCDRSGSLSKERYDYQLYLAIFMLLERFFTQEDFVFLFEYQDDFIIINSNSTPKQIEFYQVKTSTRKEWTLPTIISEDIINKMYQNKLNFPNNTKSLNFISNQYCKFMVGMFDRVNANTFNEKDKDAIRKSIQKLSPDIEPEFDIIYFERSKLQIEGYDNQLIGEMSTFISKIFKEEKCNLRALTLSLIEMARRKSNNRTEGFKDYNELVKEKGISKKDIEFWLKQSEAYIENKVKWENIEPNLPKNNAILNRKLRSEFNNYTLRKMTPDDLLFNTIVDEITYNLNYKDFNNKTLFEISNIISDDIHNKYPSFSKELIQAGVLYEYYAN